MKKIFLIMVMLTISFVLTAVAFAQESKDTEDFAAKITFDKTILDIGKVSKDSDNVNFEFSFANTGNAPLVLTYVHPSCSCIRLEYPREPIAPGDSSHIIAKLLPSTIHETSFKRNILVKSNAGKPVRLFIIGKIKP